MNKKCLEGEGEKRGRERRTEDWDMAALVSISDQQKKNKMNCHYLP